MATVPPHLPPPRQPPPSPMPMPLAALAESPVYARSYAAAASDENAWGESVAESWFPTLSSEDAVIDADGSGGEEEDGCESCVDGGDGEDEEEGSEVVWSWSHDGSGGCFIWPPTRTTTGCSHASDDDEDDLQAAAAVRQEEDRKFWEACLASGYP